MLQHLAGRAIRVEVVASRNDIRVLIAPRQLEQILMNLVANARDAMPKGGSIRLSVEATAVDDAAAAGVLGIQPGDYALLEVRDTGSGIDKRTLKKIFEPFFTTKEPGKGTGLGLAIVCGLVSQGAGGIAVDSDVGQGTCFRIYWPRAKEDEVGDQVPSFQPNSGQGKTIVVVDDEPSMCSLVSEMLIEHGYQVFCAHTREAALSIVETRGEAVDMVLTDVEMPGISVEDFVQRLSNASSMTRVLCMSAYVPDSIGTDESLMHGLMLVRKPFTKNTLLTRVHERLKIS